MNESISLDMAELHGRLPSIAIQIPRFIDEHQPGLVECVLLDANGVTHRFVEKAPVVSRLNLHSGSAYPCPGALGCELESEWKDDAGRSLVRVNTERPWHIESTGGETRFVILESQLVR